MAADSTTKRGGGGNEMSAPLTQPVPRQARAVTWRSVLLGLMGVIFICSLSPYNDWVVNNTYLVGDFMPVGLLLFFFVVVMLINAPLWRWAPRQALGAGELAVALGMTLVACTLPGSGLMRYLVPFIIAPYHHAGQNPLFLQVLREINLPDWMFPDFRSDDLAERTADPVVSYFVGRVPVEQEGFWARFTSVPWSAWARPAMTWGILLAALYGAILCMAVIVRRQWVENERLAFPLATIYLSLIEQPSVGRAFNVLLRSRGFWIAFGVVFFIHLVNGLHRYEPQFVPEIPLRFDLQDELANPPWVYMHVRFKAALLVFSMVGITFFVQSKVAFSLWFFFVLLQVAQMLYGTHQAELTAGMRVDQLFGALVVFAGVLVWLGRAHFTMVIRQMFRGAREGEPPGRYLPYSVAGWGLVLCTAAMVVWLISAGASLAGAVVIVLMLFLLFLVVARLVAETGILFTQLPVPINRFWIFLLHDFPGQLRTTGGSYFLGGMFYGVLGHDLREASSVYTTHALRIADEAAYDREHGWRRAIWFTAALGLALAVGIVVAGMSKLYIHYSYASTMDELQTSPVSPYAVNTAPVGAMLNPTVEYLPPRTGPAEAHSRLGHFGFGAALTAGLSVLRLRYVGWPLHPAGFLLVYSYGVAALWFSIFIGWLLKVLIVRFGGATMFHGARPFFIGLIIGEAGVAAFWLLVALSRNMLGLPYYAIHVTPQ